MTSSIVAMCGSDIFLGILAVFFPPVAGKSPAALLENPGSDALDSMDQSGHLHS